jgi:hypothetical protein
MPIAIFIIAIGILLRLIPHMPNFAPVGAIAMFAGIYLDKKWSWAIPIAMMFISDLFIGIYDWKIMATVYACFILSVLIGHMVARIKSVEMKSRHKIAEVKPRGSFEVSPRQIPRVLKLISIYAGASLSGSIIFFLVTNAAVVFFGSWYPHTLQGLTDSYVAAIPFFRNTITSDLFYLAIFSSSFELASHLARKLAYRKVRI